MASPDTEPACGSSKAFPKKSLFFIIKAFVVGVILSIGFIHVLSDTNENLTSHCLSENPWDKFPLAKLLAMAAKIGTLMVDVFATSHYTKSRLHKTHESNYVDEEKIGKNKNHLHVHTHATHGHAHDSVAMLDRSNSTQLLRLQICFMNYIYLLFYENIYFMILVVFGVFNIFCN
ncbi:hypothetical protein V6Z11_A01G218000 [Gossypium hirsutum]